MPHQKPGTLIVHPQEEFASNTNVDALVLRYLDRTHFTAHVACPPRTADNPAGAFEVFSQIADVGIHTLRFAPTLRYRSRLKALTAAAVAAPALLGGFGSLAGYIRRNNIRVLRSCESPRDTTYSLLLARATGARVVTHVHALPGAWMQPLTLRNMHRADAIVCVSNAVAHVLKAMGYPAEKIFTVYNGLELQHWNPQTDGSALRAEFGIPADVPLISTIARIYPGKGFVDALRALATIKHDVPDFRILIVGEDDRAATPGMASHTAELKALAATLGISEKVVFTGFRTDVEQVLAATDIYAMASPNEAFGLVYLEALAMHVPVVALNAGGTPELVVHGDCGLLSAPGDVPALAANLRTLLNAPQLRAHLGANGRRRVERHFSAERLGQQMGAVFHTVLSERKPS